MPCAAIIPIAVLACYKPLVMGSLAPMQCCIGAMLTTVTGVQLLLNNK